MANYLRFDSSSSLHVQVLRGEGSGGNNYSTELAKAVPALVAAVQAALAAMPSEQRPKELSVTAYLQALEKGGFAIVQGGQFANFTVTFAWKGGSGEGGPPQMDQLSES